MEVITNNERLQEMYTRFFLRSRCQFNDQSEVSDEGEIAKAVLYFQLVTSHISVCM
jgi:hypothetical protein